MYESVPGGPLPRRRGLRQPRAVRFRAGQPAVIVPVMLDRVLARWGLSPLPDDPVARLKVLHAAFVRHVPFENVTKLLRARAVRNVDEARRTPGIFWSDHLSFGGGGTCFATTAAFAGLLNSAGLPAAPAFAELEKEDPRAHAVLLVQAGREAWMSDVGYALAAPVPLPGRTPRIVGTAQYDVELRRGARGELQVLTEDALGRRFRYRFRPKPASAAAYEEAWRTTLLPDAPYLARLALGRMGRRRRWLYRDPDEVVVLSRRGMRPRRVAGPAALSRWFGLPEELIRRAMELLDG